MAKYAMFCICNGECLFFFTYNSFDEARDAMKKEYQQALIDEGYDPEMDETCEADDFCWIHTMDHIGWYIKPLF